MSKKNSSENYKLRERALTKAKSKINNLTMIPFCGFIAFSLVFLLYGGRGFTYALIVFAAKLISLIFSIAGATCVGVSAWRRSKAFWGDFLIGFKSLRVVKACFVPFILTSAFYALAFAVKINILATLITLLVASVIEYVSKWICYYLFIEEMSPIDSIKGGIAVLKNNLAQIFAMEMQLRLWMWIISAGIAFLCSLSNSVSTSGAITIGFVVMASLKYAIVGFNSLASAGLARTLIKGGD